MLMTPRRRLTARLAVALLLANAPIPARAGSITFAFSGTILNSFGVPNAGTTVSGYLNFDPSVPNSSANPDLGDYLESAPAAFLFTTNGGLTLQQTLTGISTEDEYLFGTSDYYVFDADVGAFSSSTDFERLELTLSDNSNPSITNVDIPTSAPDFSAFQFHTVDFHYFAGDAEVQLIAANLTELTLVPEPRPSLMLGVAGLGLVVIASRRFWQETTLRAGVARVGVANIGSIQIALMFVLAVGLLPAHAQDAEFKGLAGVQVAVEWATGADSDRNAIQNETELKLRQSGMRVLTKEENDRNLVIGHPILLIIVDGTSPWTIVSANLLERVQPERSLVAYWVWLEKRKGLPTPISDSEWVEHAGYRAGTTWSRYGVARNGQSESVQTIVARYRPQLFDATPAGRQILQHMMDLEVEAANANLQRGANPGPVRDVIRGYVDEFLNAWLAANPREQH